MYTLGRLLQLVGLAIPPLAIVSELTGQQPNPGLMLRFLMMAVGIFLVGYILQRYSGGNAA